MMKENIYVTENPQGIADAWNAHSTSEDDQVQGIAPSSRDMCPLCGSLPSQDRHSMIFVAAEKENYRIAAGYHSVSAFYCLMGSKVVIGTLVYLHYLAFIITIIIRNRPLQLLDVIPQVWSLIKMIVHAYYMNTWRKEGTLWKPLTSSVSLLVCLIGIYCYYAVNSRDWMSNPDDDSAFLRLKLVEICYQLFHLISEASLKVPLVSEKARKMDIIEKED